jgi:hypothetical protein
MISVFGRIRAISPDKYQPSGSSDCADIRGNKSLDPNELILIGPAAREIDIARGKHSFLRLAPRIMDSLNLNEEAVSDVSIHGDSERLRK